MNSEGGRASLAAGDTIAHFRVEAKLGAGGMGVVYRAHDTQLARLVALKVLAPKYEHDADRRRRFLREARLAAAITHPNIAAVYEVGEANGRAYFAMELVDGKTLREHIDAGPLSLAEATRLAGEIARGVAKAHEKGVVHRDLKPDNIVVTAAGEAKILDFGLAKLREAHGSLLYVAETALSTTLDKKVTGTPGYMAPEQISGKEESFRTDVFAFGVILYELLTGVRPFEGSTQMEVLIASTRDEMPSAMVKNAAVTPALEAFLLRCLEKQPSARFADGGELAAALDAASGKSTSSLASLSPASFGSKRRGRSLGIVAVVAFVAAAAVAAIAIYVPTVRSSVHPSSSSAAPVASDPGALDSPSPEARAAFAAGMRHLHSGAWAAAASSFERAVAADPSSAAAHLRFAMTLSGGVGSISQTQIELQKATELRASLSRRDQIMLDALEPALQRTPPDTSISATRFEQAVAVYPADAELYQWLAYAQVPDPNKALASFTRATEIDPQLADGWEGRGRMLAWLGDLDGARRTFDRCIEIPTALDCFHWRRAVESADGKCDACVQWARARIDRDPSSAIAYRDLAQALLGSGAPIEAAVSALDQSYSRSGDGDRDREKLSDQSDVAIIRGDFATAIAVSKRQLMLAEHDADGTYHFRPTQTLVRALLEVGDEKGAGDVADAFVRRSAAWTTVEGTFDKDDVPWLLHVAYRAGKLAAGDFEAARDAWVDKWAVHGRANPGYIWALAYAETVDTRDEAEVALSRLPALGTLPAFFLTFSNVELHVGVTFARAGRTDEALVHLERAAKNCARLGDPFAHPHAELELGLVREHAGDAKGACDAYRAVVAQWGDAKPRSVTAERARDRSRALACSK